jgi:hypothetical protein
LPMALSKKTQLYLAETETEPPQEHLTAQPEVLPAVVQVPELS